MTEPTTTGPNPPNPNPAAVRIREMLGERTSLLGLDAIEFKAGAIVLLVVSYPGTASTEEMEHLGGVMSEVVTDLQACGVKACGVMLREEIALRALEFVPEVSP